MTTTALYATSDPKTPKGERTRARILETALQLFRDRGYDETTMRTIAWEAGVSLGNAYYYFRSKEQLIQAFYGRTHIKHQAACRDVLASERGLRARLLGVMLAKLDTIDTYHRFAGVLFKSAADPASPLNPFSHESLPVRRESTMLFAEVVEDSRQRVPAVLAAELPHLLWLYHMGIILFWVHDRSPGCRRSYELVDRSVDLVVLMIRMAALPLFRPLVRKTLDLLTTLALAPGTPEPEGA